MAAIDLRGATLPTCYTFTAATTWQEVKLPPSVRYTIDVGSTAGYLGFARNGATASPEEPTDGGAVGTHKVSILASSQPSRRVTADSKVPSGQSIFIAASSGTPTYTVELEHVEG